jgi:protein kinase C substrate 80K-H
MIKGTNVMLTLQEEYEELEDEEEFKEEESYKHEEAPLPSEHVDYDESTKQIVEQAKQARQEYSEVETRHYQAENKIRELESSLSHDYGQEDEFMALQGHCFDYTDREYTYRFCPFDRASQISLNGGGDISLGFVI